MPTAYEQLLLEAAPQVIETEREYEEIVRRAGDLVGKNRKRTPEETKLMRLLLLLVEDYDRRHAMPPDDSTPAEYLQFLVEHPDKPPNELFLPVSAQRSHFNKAPTGKRAI